MEARRYATFAVALTTALVVTHTLFFREQEYEGFVTGGTIASPGTLVRNGTHEWDVAYGYFPHRFYQHWASFPHGWRHEYRLVRVDYGNLGWTLLSCAAVWAVALVALRACARGSGAAGTGRPPPETVTSPASPRVGRT